MGSVLNFDYMSTNDRERERESISTQNVKHFSTTLNLLIIN